MELERSNVQLHARVANKAEAIQKAGALLVASQYMKPGYIDRLMGREKVANTFLGSGIAIPHGLPKDRDLILRTGIIPRCCAWSIARHKRRPRPASGSECAAALPATPRARCFWLAWAWPS